MKGYAGFLLEHTGKIFGTDGMNICCMGKCDVRVKVLLHIFYNFINVGIHTYMFINKKIIYAAV